LAMNSEKTGKGEIINLGTGRNHSVLEVAQIIGGPHEFIEARQGEVAATLADNSLAKELLGWTPQISFESGIAELKKLHQIS